MAVTISGTSGITTPAETVSGASSVGSLSVGGVTSAAFVGARAQLFTTVATGQTFTIPAGITALKVTVIAGGGGGGNASTAGAVNVGAGGGGGGVAVKWLTGLTSGATLTVAVGGGGASATAGGASSVASGTQTISTISATAGSGGASNIGTNATTAGGAGSGGDLNFAGGYGSGINTYIICGNAGASSGAGGGAGGASALSIYYGFDVNHLTLQQGGYCYLGGRAGDGVIQAVSGGQNGNASPQYGGGGGGAAAYTTTGKTGGAGGQGVVIFEW